LLYPEAASQLLNSLQRTGEGGWFCTGWFGKNGVVMSLPAVQDDFIAAFLLNRFGGFMGVLLVTVQFFWLLSLFRLSSWLRNVEAARQVETAFQLLGYVVYGLAWVHLLHWLISWSNVLGWLPIMGQPMTWLSAGNSHLLAIGMPTLLLGLLAGWVRQVE
jgi:cell division protein FtsW (lipid II flippase)